MNRRITLAALLLAGCFFTLASAQQPNSFGATMTVNNKTGPGLPIIADVPSPSTAFMVISGEPVMRFALITGISAPSWLSFPGVGSLDIFPGGAQIIANGFAPMRALDAFAVTSADDGTAFFASPIPAGSLGLGPTFQAMVADPTSPAGATFTASTRLNFTQGTGSGSGAAAAVSASGVSGGTAGTLLAEVRAPIDAITGTTITVLQTVIVDTNASTNVRGLNNSTIPFSSLAVGDFVKVEMFFDSNTMTWIAHQIRRELPAAGYQVKVDGAIDSVGMNDVTLLGVLFTAVPSSQIQITGGLAALVAGDYVEIKANFSNGGYEIVEIHRTNANLGIFDTFFRTRSFVDATTANTITVLGVTINVGAGARFDGFSNLASLTTSTYVEVRANPDASGDLWATRIKIRNPDNEVRVTGPADMLMNPDFAIYGILVHTTGSTQWQDGLTSFGDLTPMLRVEVKGTFTSGTITAQEVGRE